MNGPVGWAGLAVSLLLAAAAAGISRWQRLGLERQIIISAARALAQLLLVGVALTLVISPGRPIWWSWLWVAAMLGYASAITRRRAPEVPHLLTLTFADFATAQANHRPGSVKFKGVYTRDRRLKLTAQRLREFWPPPV